MTQELLKYQKTLDKDVDQLIARAVDEVSLSSRFLANIVSYHLGWLDENFAAVDTRTVNRGKRIRPLITLLVCDAVSGSLEPAVPVAAAIEMFHNFTLVHDDIQDQSPVRRHRQTIWSKWGVAQGINAGDAMFALSQVLILKAADYGVPESDTIELTDRFNIIASEIVAGQSLDLSFESRDDVSPDDYLEMIRRKTAVLIGFAAWSGAIAGREPTSTTDAFRHFGVELGLSFQIRDDLLGIWGDSYVTGKASNDDIRRKKKSLPILELRARATPSDSAILDEIYGQQEIDEAGHQMVLDLLDRYRIRDATERAVEHHHENAIAALRSAIPDLSTNTAGLTLESLTNSLLHRDS